MLTLFEYRANEMIHSYEANGNKESYFPTLFPFGKKSTRTVDLPFETWDRHVINLKLHCFLVI